MTDKIGCTATDEFTVKTVVVANQLNFALASTGTVGERVYAVNLSPYAIRYTQSVWKMTGSGSVNAGIYKNESDLLIFTPYQKGEITVDLTANQGTCIANITKKITIQNAVQRTAPVINKVDLIEDLFLVYPNPSSGSFEVESDVSLTGQIKVSVLDATFSKIYFTEVYDNSLTNKVKVNLQGIDTAILYVVIEANNKKIIKRVFMHN
jgi:hypothetical protein